MADLDISGINLPSNIEAEQAILGALILDAHQISRVNDKITPEHFYMRMHSGIYGVINMMFISGEEINIISIIDKCVKQGVFDSEDEAKAYIFKLAHDSIENASLESLAKILDDKLLTRQLISASKEIYDLAVSNTEEAHSMLDFAEKKIYDIRNEKEIKGLRHIGPLVRDKLRELIHINEHPEDANKKGLSSGFPSVDRLIFGLNPSDLIIIAARPGMGKTTFAMNIAVNAARISRNKKVAVFSLEMSAEQLVSRMLSSEGRISSDQIRTGRFEKSQWRGIHEAAEMLNQIDLYIDDTPGISLGEMKAKLRRVENLGLVVIDYLQLMSTNRKDGNRVNEISEITRNLKIMAKELNVPVITLSQLSRGPENRTDKKPMMSDLRESGSIEQDADIIIFLYRDFYYSKDENDMDTSECIIAKNRHGATDSVQLRFDGQYTKFTDLETRYGG